MSLFSAFRRCSSVLNLLRLSSLATLEVLAFLGMTQCPGRFAASMASLLSVLLAYMLAGVMAAVMEDVIFFIPIIFVAGPTVMTIVMGAAFVMLSSFVPIDHMSRLDTGRSTRERTVT
jgi:hypothetical protein